MSPAPDRSRTPQFYIYNAPAISSRPVDRDVMACHCSEASVSMAIRASRDLREIRAPTARARLATSGLATDRTRAPQLYMYNAPAVSTRPLDRDAVACHRRLVLVSVAIRASLELQEVRAPQHTSDWNLMNCDGSEPSSSVFMYNAGVFHALRTSATSTPQYWAWADEARPTTRPRLGECGRSPWRAGVIADDSRAHLQHV